MNVKDLIKSGILTEIAIDKVSLVKSPANQRRFIFTKQANIEFSGSTDQTFDGTTITVNGEELEDLDSFHFSLVNWSEEDIEEWGASPVSLSFTTKKSSVDGLDIMETFSLHSEVKKTMEKSEILKAIKENLGVELDEAGFDKLSVEKQKAMEGLAVFSPAFNGQPVFRDAVQTFVKSDVEAEEGEETADATAEIDPVLLAIAGLKADIDGLKAKASETSEEAEETTEETEEEVAEETEENAETPVMKAIAKLAADLALVKTAAGVKESEEQDIAKSGGDVKDDYKSWEM